MHDASTSWLRASLLLGVGLLLLYGSAMIAGGGHGSYLPAKLFFPFTMLLTAWSGDSISPLGLVVAVLQMPVYSVLVDIGRRRKAKGAWLIRIGFVHAIIFVGTLFFIRNFPEWPQ
jgi:hypothetical protein